MEMMSLSRLLALTSCRWRRRVLSLAKASPHGIQNHGEERRRLEAMLLAIWWKKRQASPGEQRCLTQREL